MFLIQNITSGPVALETIERGQFVLEQFRTEKTVKLTDAVLEAKGARYITVTEIPDEKIKAPKPKKPLPFGKPSPANSDLP